MSECGQSRSTLKSEKTITESWVGCLIKGSDDTSGEYRAKLDSILRIYYASLSQEGVETRWPPPKGFKPMVKV